MWVRRGELPEWYGTALSANQGHNWALNELKLQKIHASETAWVGTEFDHVLDNDGSIDDLYHATASIISNEISLLPG